MKRFRAVPIRRWALAITCLVGLLVAGAAEAQQLQLFVDTNQDYYMIGDTITYSLAVQNPGGIPRVVDFFLGVLKPDGSIKFFTPSGFALGHVSDLTTFVPIASGIPLTSAFTITAPNFLSETVGLLDLVDGDHFFFLLAGTIVTLDGVTPHDALGILMAGVGAKQIRFGVDAGY